MTFYIEMMYILCVRIMKTYYLMIISLL